MFSAFGPEMGPSQKLRSFPPPGAVAVAGAPKGARLAHASDKTCWLDDQV